MRNIDPNMAKNVNVIARFAAVKRGFLKKLMSSIGWSVYRSHRMKQATPTMPMTKAVSTVALPQPSVGPSMMANSRAPRPTIDNPAPSGSSLGAVGSFDSGTKKMPRTMATTAIGRFTQNTELHEKWASRMPPITGPMATPRPENPAQMAMARPRSRGSRNTLVRIDRVDGMISAPPTPIRQRAAMSWLGVLDSADSTEPAAKMMMPVRNASLRPKRSPRLPVVSSRPANTRV